MLGRTLFSATVALLTGCFTSASAQAQNLEAGKTPSQIFAGTCTACHKSPRGLLRTVPPGSLTGFLRQHYTTSPEMAGLLAGYLVSNGAADTRYGGGQAKPNGKPGASSEPLDRQGRRVRTPLEPGRPGSDSQAVRPEGAAPGEVERRSRAVRRPPAEGEAAEPGGEHAEGRKLNAKRRLMGRHGHKPVVDQPSENDVGNGDAAKDAVKTGTTKEESGKSRSREEKPASEAAKPEIRQSDEDKSPSSKPASSKSESSKPESSKSESPKSESSGSDAGKAETPAENTRPSPRADTVTPAPKTTSSGHSAASGGTGEPATSPSSPPAAPSGTATSSPSPSGSPVPPLSR